MADLLPRNRALPNTTSQRGDTSQVLPSMRSPSSALVAPFNRLVYSQILTRCFLSLEPIVIGYDYHFFNLSSNPHAILLSNPSDVASRSGNLVKAIEEKHPKEKVFEHSGLLGSKEVDEGPLKGKRVEVVAQHPLSSWASSLLKLRLQWDAGNRA
ncbi:hypothetical protein TNCV_1370101 [Trichonephila clavipes]|nr:hypothetical protein TNCV_1370101 [Trichonephila clavipes]